MSLDQRIIRTENRTPLTRIGRTTPFSIARRLRAQALQTRSQREVEVLYPMISKQQTLHPSRLDSRTFSAEHPLVKQQITARPSPDSKNPTTATRNQRQTLISRILPVLVIAANPLPPPHSPCNRHLIHPISSRPKPRIPTCEHPRGSSRQTGIRPLTEVGRRQERGARAVLAEGGKPSRSTQTLKHEGEVKHVRGRRLDNHSYIDVSLERAGGRRAMNFNTTY
jgi:hypothetical protein